MRDQETRNGAGRGGRRVIVHTPEPGVGSGQYVAELVGALAGKGERVALFCPSNFLYEDEVAAKGAEIIRAPVRDVRDAHLGRRVMRNLLFLMRALKKFCAEVRRDDIVHFQFALLLGLGLPFFFAARAKGASVVLTVHDPLPHRWILPKPFRWVETALLGIGYSLCDHLIVHNQAGRRVLIEKFNMDASAVSVIPHGPLNLAPAMPPPLRRAAELEPLRLLVFGTLRENKGLHLSIAAIQQLRLVAAGRPVNLTIAGRVAQAIERVYWERCRELIEAQPDGIEVIERGIDDAEIGPLFAAHDAILLPYVEFSSDSGVAMLALSQQRPILATAAGGLGELLREADCGILIEAATVEALVDGIEKARRAPASWLRQKGLNGYKHALNGRSWKAIAEQTQDLYDGLQPREVATPMETVL